MSGPKNKSVPLKAKGLSKRLFSERVLEARTALKRSQEDVVEAIGSSKGYLSNIENGYSYPSLDRAVALANTLGVSLDYLCGREEYLNNKPITMGDIARVLSVLPFLDGIDCKIVDADVAPDSSAQTSEKKSTKKKRVALIKVEKKPLNKFLDTYERRLTYRIKYADFVKWREEALAKLDAIAAWEKRDVEKWNQHVDPGESWTFPEEKFKPLIWNRSFPYVPKDTGNDMIGKTDSVGE